MPAPSRCPRARREGVARISLSPPPNEAVAFVRRDRDDGRDDDLSDSLARGSLMPRITPLFVVLLLSSFGLADDPKVVSDDDHDKAVRASVVKIEAVTRRPDLSRPWLRPTSLDVGGSGMVIDGKRILTNAHVVAYSTSVTVQSGKGSEKFSAKVEAIATGIDLAVLKVDDESFFEKKPPLPVSTAIPRDRENVLVYGYPTGGASVSVTKGIVSRVEFVDYDGETSALRAQVDAAINPGNSGGPVVAGGKLVGVAFSRLGGADNIGYMIPSVEVALFLEDVKDGRYDGKPALYDVLQTLENPALRKKLNVPAGVSGIVVHRPEPPIAGKTPLKEWDLITKIGDHAVENTGQSPVSEGLDLRFQYFVQTVARDGNVPLTILRDGKMMEIQVPVASRRPLVLPSLKGGTPSYFICGPLAFSNATKDIVDGAEAMQRGWYAWMIGNRSPLTARLYDRPEFDGEQLVMIPCPMFSHKIVRGYSDTSFQTVSEINGVRIKNLRHLVETIRDCKDETLTISFAETHAETIVLNRKETLAATEEVMIDNSIRKLASDDMLAIWEKK
ncbi:MAG: trypsin-like serine protease with C-terminal domain [Planctomycetota bacterium]|nr:trypsin-like serine protease with C-terminal domain [Planctomycetota bacterium]